MHVFLYDATFDGLLSAIFDAYTQKIFPNSLAHANETLPLHACVVHTVVTEGYKCERVATGLKKRLPQREFDSLLYAWLAKEEKGASFLFRIIRKIFDSDRLVAQNFADEDMLLVRKLASKVTKERHHLTGFIRFQKTKNGCYFAPIAPAYDVLPLLLPHFADRFADQKWIIYDTARNYGIYFDTQNFHTAHTNKRVLKNGSLPDDILADDELLLQAAWKKYCSALCIEERRNIRLHKRLLPKRFWPYLTEKKTR